MSTKQMSWLEWGVLLLFFLPPIGIVWIIGLGIYYVLNRLLCGQTIYLLQPAPIFFLALALASFGASVQSGRPTHLFISILVLGYFGIYMYIKEENTSFRPETFKWLIVVGGLYIAAIGQLQLQKGYVYGGNWWLGMLTGLAPLGLEEPNRLFGSAYNPNFAMFLLLLALACLISGMLQTVKSREKRSLILILHFMLAMPLMLAIIQTGSRTGVAIMFFLFALLAWKINSRITVAIMTISASLLVYTGSFSNVIPRFDSMVQSFETRQTIWKYSIQVWTSSPVFGVTPLGFQQAYAVFEKTGIAHAHNLFLGFFCEYGVIGGTALLLLTISYLYKARKMLGISKWQRKRMALFFFTLPILPLTGIFDHPLTSPQTALIAIILLGSWDRDTDSAQQQYPVFPLRKQTVTLSRSIQWGKPRKTAGESR